MRASYLSFLAAIALLLALSHASGQDRKIDSLTRLEQTAPNDSLRIMYHVKIALTYLSVNSIKAMQTAQQALDMAQKAKHQQMTGRSYNAIGICFTTLGQYDSAVAAYQKAIDRLTYPPWLSDSYLNLGTTYQYMNRLDKSLEAFLKSLQILGKDDNEKYFILGSISNTYRKLKNLKMAEQYDTMAIAAAKREKGSEEIVSLLEGNYAMTLNQLNRLREARKFLNRAIAYTKKTGQLYYLANHYEVLADIETKEKNYEAAHRYLLEALKIHKEGGNEGELAESYKLLAALDLLRDDFAEAERMARQALLICDSLHITDGLNEIHGLLAQIALTKHDIKAYFHHDSISQVLSDSINLQGQARAISELKTRYETEKKENENVLLRQKQLSQELVVKNQRYAIVLVTGSLIAVIVFLVIFYQNNKKAKKTNLELTLKNQAILNQQAQILQQNNEIENKNQELQLRIEEIQRIQDQLIQSEKMASLGQMTAGIAHEINNPLNFISGGVQGLGYSYDEMMQMLQKPQTIAPEKVKEVGTDAKELFTALKNGVDRMHKIINSLRSFSSPQKTEQVDTRIEEVIEMALTLLTPKIKDFNVQVERHYHPDVSAVPVNSVQISQVFVNVIDNAIQAMENVAGPHILKIETMQASDRVEIKITDNGVGIAPRDQSHIMDPFFTTKPVGKGTGLGLSISYGIIESHKGKISFESEVGKGTCFTICLPCKSAS